VTGADFQASDCSTYNVCTTTLTRTQTALSDYPEGTPERRAVLTNMSNIRWAIARRGPAP
jgi:hypothetical protein